MAVAVVLARSIRATATTFPSIEYVDEKHCVEDICGSEGMVPSGPPVCRSQLVSSHWVLTSVNSRLSGEKQSH